MAASYRNSHTFHGFALKSHRAILLGWLPARGWWWWWRGFDEDWHWEDASNMNKQKPTSSRMFQRSMRWIPHLPPLKKPPIPNICEHYANQFRPQRLFFFCSITPASKMVSSSRFSSSKACPEPLPHHLNHAIIIRVFPLDMLGAQCDPWHLVERQWPPRRHSTLLKWASIAHETRDLPLYLFLLWGGGGLERVAAYPAKGSAKTKVIIVLIDGEELTTMMMMMIGMAQIIARGCEEDNLAVIKGG